MGVGMSLIDCSCWCLADCMYWVTMQECNRDWIACIEVVAIVNVGAFPSIRLPHSTYNLFPSMLCEKRQWGNVVRFSSPKVHGRHPLKSSLTESVRTRDFTKWTPHLHIGLRKLARHDKTEKASFPEKQNSVNCKSNAPLSLWRQFCCLFGSQWRSQ